MLHCNTAMKFYNVVVVDISGQGDEHRFLFCQLEPPSSKQFLYSKPKKG